MSRAIRLEYQLSNKKTPLDAYLLLISGVIAMTVFLLHLNEVNSHIKAIKVEIEKIKQPENNSARGLAQTQFTVRPEEMAAVNDARSALLVPWGQLFQALESLDVPAVRLLTVNPDAKQGNIQISAEAPTRTDMLDYVNALAKRPELSDVFLTEHKKSDKNADYPIRFTVEAVWSWRHE